MDGFLRESNTVERILLLSLNVFSAWLGMRLYRVVSRDRDRYHPLMTASIVIFIIMNLLAAAMNASGRLQIARTLSNSSVLSITLLLALQIIRETFLEFIFLNLEARKHSKFSSAQEFERFRSGFGNMLRAVTLVLWVMAFAWSLNFLDLIMEKAGGFLRKTRSVGEIEFTFGSILVFLLTVWIAFTIANIINFLLKRGEDGLPAGRKGRTGSWVLLLRAAIISAGFLVAVAAAGIPMDKLTIILGSLGVGIGFGLQNIVSNLMSGIMLAFEKPMQTGDVIELGNQIGTVKEIGLRSSKIATYDGAVIIVPNGDFITQRLINWTHDNNHFRRVELIIGVRYGSDIGKVRQVIDAVIKADPEVAPHPPPVILVNELGSSSVNVRVLVWTSEFDRWVAMKGRLLEEIYAAFARNGIEIPYPQTDLHLRSISTDAARAFGNPPGTGRSDG
jgi:small-conductance mechanosensitive channel